jgi:hypothetical protein
MPKKFWWPSTMADQLVLAQNFGKKIGEYAAALPLTPAQVTAAEALCTAFAGAFDFTEGCRTTMQAATQWRDMVFYGEPEGTAAPPPPIFPVGVVSPYTRGVVKQLFALRDLIVALPGYTQSIGDDLGIVGAEITPRPPAEVTPDLRPSTSVGYWVNLTGSMQGMDAMRVEYAPKGGSFSTVAFLTNTPGGFQITPANPNQPETGHIRAVFIKKNADFGNYSPDYPVTVS